MTLTSKAGMCDPIPMGEASRAGVGLDTAMQAYSHIARRHEDKEWLDIKLLNLPKPTAAQRDIDYEALRMPIEWHLDPLRELQPRSHAAFWRLGPPELLLLEAVWDDIQFGPMSAWNIFIHVNGRLLEFAVGDGQEGYFKRMHSDVWLSLPTAISRSWLWRSTGWRLPRQVPPAPMLYRQMVCCIVTQGVDDIIKSYGDKASVSEALVTDLIARFPDISPSRKGGRLEMRCFLDTRPMGVSGPVGDQFFTRSRMRDGTVYHIRNGDAANLRTLENPVEAIDCYHEHLLLKRPGEFDFSPWDKLT